MYFVTGCFCLLLLCDQDYAGMNEVYNTYFTDCKIGPCRTCVAVHQLPHPNLLVEMKVIAVVPEKKEQAKKAKK